MMSMPHKKHIITKIRGAKEKENTPYEKNMQPQTPLKKSAKIKEDPDAQLVRF